MANFLTATVKIKGTRPLMWHVFGPDSIPLERREREGVAGNDPSEWKRSCLITENGQLYLRGDYAFGTIIEGARYTKAGRGTIQAKMRATLQVMDEQILVNRFIPQESELTSDPGAPVYLDIRSVRNPATKGRNIRYRITASPGWEATFNILWNKTIISRNEMENALHDAGMLVGIGDGRAIGMGRFEVVDFDAKEEA